MHLSAHRRPFIVHLSLVNRLVAASILVTRGEVTINSWHHLVSLVWAPGSRRPHLIRWSAFD